MVSQVATCLFGTWSLRLINMGGCQNYGPSLGTLNIRCPIILGTQKRDHNFDNPPYGLAFTNNVVGLIALSSCWKALTPRAETLALKPKPKSLDRS